jgi:hypothetical protein
MNVSRGLATLLQIEIGDASGGRVIIATILVFVPVLVGSQRVRRKTFGKRRQIEQTVHLIKAGRTAHDVGQNCLI